MSGNPYLIPNYKTMQNDTKTESTCDVTLEQQYLMNFFIPRSEIPKLRTKVFLHISGFRFQRR